jgi:hypothetical protein
MDKKRGGRSKLSGWIGDSQSREEGRSGDSEEQSDSNLPVDSCDYHYGSGDEDGYLNEVEKDWEDEKVEKMELCNRHRNKMKRKATETVYVSR